VKSRAGETSAPARVGPTANRGAKHGLVSGSGIASRNFEFLMEVALPGARLKPLCEPGPERKHKRSLQIRSLQISTDIGGAVYGCESSAV
jgi:hypothetical protein